VRAAGSVVLDPVSGEDVGLAVLQLDRDLHGDLAVRRPEDDAQIVGNAQVIAGAVEVVADDVEVGDLGALARLVRLGAVRLLGRLLDGLRRFVGLFPLADGALVLRLGIGHHASSARLTRAGRRTAARAIRAYRLLLPRDAYLQSADAGP